MGPAGRCLPATPGSSGRRALSVDAELQRARKLLSGKTVLVLTGAGVSAESGVPTFRGPEGLWRSHRPEDLATARAFARDPALVWEWYAWRQGLVTACEPNPAHRALAALSARTGTPIATQNVDGLHGRAALDAEEGAPLPLELHGSLFRVRCTACGSEGTVDRPVDLREGLPRCMDCDGLLRPAVVWFGEALPEDILDRAFALAAAAEACLVVGTSAVVHPAASLPRITGAAGGHVVEVNPHPTGLTELADVTIRGTAASVVPDLVDSIGLQC